MHTIFFALKAAVYNYKKTNREQTLINHKLAIHITD